MTELKLTDILPQLAAWFPPEAHKERKLPGGGKWYFVPHQSVRDRLNEICPGDWHDEYKGPFVSGNESVMICRLTICGVTREGIADNKTFPELNDEGKEKIIGSPVINAARHAFRDAAEKFGVGAYLDLQKSKQKSFVNYMRGRNDGRAYKAAYDNGWLKQDEAETVEHTENEQKPKKVISSAPLSQKPKPVAKPEPAASPLSMYPQHDAAIEKVRSLTGHEQGQIAAQCKAITQGKSEQPSRLSPDEFEQLLESLMLGWSLDYFPTVEHAHKAYNGKVKFLIAAGASIETAINSFIESVKAAPART